MKCGNLLCPQHWTKRRHTNFTAVNFTTVQVTKAHLYEVILLHVFQYTQGLKTAVTFQLVPWSIYMHNPAKPPLHETPVELLVFQRKLNKLWHHLVYKALTDRSFKHTPYTYALKIVFYQDVAHKRRPYFVLVERSGSTFSSVPISGKVLFSV